MADGPWDIIHENFRRIGELRRQLGTNQAEIKALKEENARLKDLIKRNQQAWETSKDKTDGLLPEVYLANAAVLGGLK